MIFSITIGRYFHSSSVPNVTFKAVHVAFRTHCRQSNMKHETICYTGIFSGGYGIFGVKHTLPRLVRPPLGELDVNL